MHGPCMTNYTLVYNTEGEYQTTTVDKLCPIRWTVRVHIVIEK